jgi:pilus assembly protein CpaE
VTGIIGIIGSNDRELEELVRGTGMRPILFQEDELSGRRGIVLTPDLVLVDLRQDRANLAMVAAVKRHFRNMPIAIIVGGLDPELMLEGMRAGVNEVLQAPVTQSALEAAISRLVVQRAPTNEGQLFAVIGAKGGVGATTIAVNLAVAFSKALGEALLVDLHLGAGDAAVFLGVEPRFTILEALENTHRLDDAFLRGLLVRTKSGLDLLGSSPRVSPGPLDPERIRTLTEFLVRFSKCVVLDVPRMDNGVLDSLDLAAAIFVVVNQELPTVRNAHPLVKRLQQRYGDNVKVLVNRSDRLSEISLDDIAKAVGVPVRHVFPNDYRQAISAANKGLPIAGSTQGRLAESFHNFARSLIGQAEVKASPTEDSGRLFGWLGARKSSSN